MLKVAIDDKKETSEASITPNAWHKFQGQDGGLQVHDSPKLLQFLVFFRIFAFIWPPLGKYISEYVPVTIGYLEKIIQRIKIMNFYEVLTHTISSQQYRKTGAKYYLACFSFLIFRANFYYVEIRKIVKRA